MPAITRLNAKFHGLPLCLVSSTGEYASPLLSSLRKVSVKAWNLVALLALFATTAALNAAPVVFPGSTVIATTSAPVTVSVLVTESSQLGSVKALTGGISGLDFAISGAGTCSTGASYTAGQICSFPVTFSPTNPGQRIGAVVLFDSAGNPMGSTWMVATGSGPLALFVPGVISTVAGSGAWIYHNGDGIPATTSQLFLPFGVAVDPGGNIFIADANNNRIRRVDGGSQIITTVAGNGTSGDVGDGGPATAAELSVPTSVAFDGAGNLYFADSNNQAIRMLTTSTGIISTIAGVLGSQGYSGDGGLATAAHLNNPNAIAIDPVNGYLYIADTGNNVVRRVDLSTGKISAYAGNHTAAYLGDNGPATSASLNAPWGVTVATNGEVYIADSTNHCIRHVALDGTITTFSGNGTAGFAGDGGPASAATLDSPSATAIDPAGNIYIADSGNNRIRKVNAADGTIATIAGNNTETFSGDGGPSTGAGLYGPYALTIDSAGDLYLTDVFHFRIRVIRSNTAILTFPTMRVQRISATENQELENDGNAPLNLSLINPVSNSQLDPVATTCSTTSPMAIAVNCIIGAQFAPTVIGTPVLGSITVTSNSPNSLETIKLSGNVQTLDPSVVTLGTSGSPSSTGSLVTFTATVTSTGVTATGAITFLDGTVSLGTAQLNSAGVAQFPIQTLTRGSHNITASYAGDTNTAPGTSSVVIQVVKDATSVAITSSLNPSSSLQSVTFTAVVSGTSGIPTGSVTFFDSSTNLGTASLDGTGTAIFSISTLSVATHHITARYGGDTNSNTSTSSTLNQQVVASSTTTALSTSNPSVSYGTTLIFTASVSGGGSGIPTGTVTFQDGTSVTLGSVNLDIHGNAALTISTLAVGPHSIRAVYLGDSNNGGSTSTSVQETITQITTVTSIATTTTPAAAGASIQLTATITPGSSVPSSPITGTVTFMEGATTLGATAVNGTTATITLSSLAVGSHLIDAVYSGATNYAGSTSALLTQSVLQAISSGTLTASANPLIAGKSEILTVSLTSNGGVPTGTVVFKDTKGDIFGTAVVNAQGVATFTVPSLTSGSYTIVAVYSGDVNTQGVSPTLNLTVQQATAGVVLTSSGAPSSIVGVPITLSATVTGNGATPTGSVTFYDNTSTALGTSPINAAGVGTLTLSSLAVGSHTLTANYSGDNYNGTSISPPITQIISKATTTTALTASATSIQVNAPVQFTATVTSTSGTPTGTVQFLDGTTVIGSPAVSSNGTAVFSTSTLIVGEHIITAQYMGDTNDSVSTSNGFTLIVQPVTTIAIASNSNPAFAGANVTFTAAVGGSGQAATGAVTFKDSQAVVGTATLNNAGVAIFNTTGLAIGTHLITASYGGDTSNNPALSSPLTETVKQAITQTSLSVNAVTPTINSPVTLTASVTGNGGIPGGPVTFYDGTNIIGTGTLSANGVATLTVSSLPLGPHTLSASYGGDTNDASSASTVDVVTVGKGTTSLTLVSSGNPSVAGLQVVFTANLSGTAATPTGSITFMDGTTTLGSSPVAANGSANLSTTTLAVGPHTIIATYVGDANNAPATSLALAETIQPSTSAITLSSNKNPALIGDTVTFAMTVSGTGAQPTGTVTLRDGANNIGTGSLDSNGFTSLAIPNLAIGSHTLVAIYNGDSSHPGSTSASLVESVLQPTTTALSSSNNPSLSGTAVVFTAIVTGNGGDPVTGTVSFRDGSTVIGNINLGATGVASFSTSTLSPGQHSIVAIYSGDSVSQTSSSPVVVQTVQDSNTTTVLSTSGTPSVAGAPLTLTAQVTGKGAAPAGVVQFDDGTTVIGTGTVGSNGIATFTTSSLAAGEHILLAIYQGDGNTLTSTSNPVLQNVEQRTTVTLSASTGTTVISGTSSAPILIGNPVTFTVTVTGSNPASQPTGQITLKDGSTVIGTAGVSSSGTATFTITTLVLGPHTLTASYGGDAENFPGTSAPFTAVVQLHPSTNSLTVSSATVVENQPFTLVATLGGSAILPPSGTVVFSAGSTTLGSATLNASGIATLTATLGLGTYSVIATYQGDSLYLGSVSTAAPVNVVPPTNFTITLNPPKLQLQTTQHSTIQLTLTSIENFTDVISLGCVGLPRAATCTFDSDQISLDANGHQTINVVIDTGSPLTAGSVAKVQAQPIGGIALCLLPGGLFIGLSLLRRRSAYRLLSNLLLALLFTGVMAMTGCGGLDVHGTPAGSYTFNVTGIGTKTAVTQTAPMTLTVTQ
jgi:large repetitive protein